MTPRRRPWLDLVIVVLLFVMAGTGLPTYLPGQKAVEDALDPVVEALGIGQANWKLFAPNVDKSNGWVEAEITWSDGSTSTWSTPDWQARNAWERLVQGRYPKIVGYYGSDNWKALSLPLARYVLREARPPAKGVKPERIVLIRHDWLIPRPQRFERAKARLGRLPPPRDRYPQRKVFLTWTPGGKPLYGEDADGDGEVDPKPERRRKRPPEAVPGLGAQDAAAGGAE